MSKLELYPNPHRVRDKCNGQKGEAPREETP